MYKLPYLVIVCSLSLLTITHAGSIPDNIQPDGISDQSWSNLKGAIGYYKLVADDVTTGDRLGISVSVFGDRALVGADADDNERGAAYIFDFDGVQWVQTAKLTAIDGSDYDLFGTSVSLFENRALVGARGDDEGTDLNTGSAYVFDFDGTNWIQSAKLTASDAAKADYLGYSVSLFGDRALVGAYGDDDLGFYSGSVYVFDFDGTNWNQSTKLIASDGAQNGNFGYSISLSGDRALVGAYGDTSSGVYSGAAYVFDFNGIQWNQTAKLTADDGAADAQFGQSVSLSGNRALIGSIRDSELFPSAGAAYVFDFDGSNWSLSAKLTADDASMNDFFGTSVSLSGDLALIGAFWEDESGYNSGSAYVFDFDGTDWNQIDKLVAGDGAMEDYFGSSVSLYNGRGLIGAFNKNDELGAAYVFGIQYDLLVDVNGLAAGNSVNISNGGDSIIVNSNGEYVLSSLSNGTSYVVNITTQPTTPNQLCSVIGSNTGTINGENITVEVECVTITYTIGGTVSGLAIGNSVILQNNGGDDLTINDNGSFTFTTPLDDTSFYDVTVLTQPTAPNQTCSVSNGAGTLAGDNVSNVTVMCSTEIYTIGGTVSGLSTGSLLLQNNGGDDLTVNADGGFTFATPLEDGSSYSVSLLSQPNTLNCTVNNASGSLNGADVNNVEVNCVLVDSEIHVSTVLADFGSVLMGENRMIVITVSNSGVIDLILNNIDALTSPFSVSGGTCAPFPITLLPSETCTIEVTYSPTGVGDHQAQMVINSNAPSSPTVVELNGNGFAAAQSVPTLGQWAMLLMIASFFMVAGLMLRAEFILNKKCR